MVRLELAGTHSDLLHMLVGTVRMSCQIINFSVEVIPPSSLQKALRPWRRHFRVYYTKSRLQVTFLEVPDKRSHDWILSRYVFKQMLLVIEQFKCINAYVEFVFSVACLLTMWILNRVQYRSDIISGEKASITRTERPFNRESSIKKVTILSHFLCTITDKWH